MPDGLRRYHHTQRPHFITFTCYHRRAHLDTPEMRDLVVVALARARVKYRFRIYGFVVMPEHLHLLVSEPERAALAQAIQSLKISSAKRSAASQGVPNTPDFGVLGWRRAASRCGSHVVTIAMCGTTRNSRRS